MVFFMGRRFDNSSATALPPRIKAAFDYLEHVRLISTQYEAAIPVRELTSIEKSVHQAALRALQQYLLGEMDFTEPPPPPAKPPKNDDEDGTAPATSGCST
jgi:hypothetical protein